jgi:FkbM family methyltransferase
MIGRCRRLVRERARFVAGELLGGTRSYTLAVAPSRRVVIRHGTRDLEILRELFQPPGAYNPPAPAAAALRRVASQRPLRIMDLGANIGLFAVDAFARYPDAEVTSYEPDPGNLPILKRCLDVNRGDDWTLVEACAAASDGPVHFDAGNFADSHISEQGPEVLALDVLPRLPAFDFVKMDIEGSEWPILGDPRWAHAMRDVSVFVVEWHARGRPGSDPRAIALAAVRGAGFAAEPGAVGWHHGTVWGWR